MKNHLIQGDTASATRLVLFIATLLHDFCVLALVLRFEICRVTRNSGFSLERIGSQQLPGKIGRGFSFNGPRFFTLDLEKYAVCPGTDEKDVSGLFGFDRVVKIRRYLRTIEHAHLAPMRYPGLG